MQVSVILHARASTQDLERTLLALRSQSHRAFEVVAVLTGTAGAPAGWAGAVRTVRCGDDRFSRCRNRGLAATSGEVVAFLDAGAAPEPRWLEELLAGYDADDVAGVGGVARDPAGRDVGPPCPVSDRRGTPREAVRPPWWGYLLPHNDQFVHLLGADASFRRRHLVEVGGFDEEIDSYLAETDLCLRLVDRGWVLRRRERAVVHHESLERHLRGDARGPARPRAAVREKAYFAGQALLPIADPLEAFEACHQFANGLAQEARGRHENGALSREELATFVDEAERGLWLGISRGRRRTRRIARVGPPKTADFLTFPTLHPEPHPLTLICAGLGEADAGATDSLWEVARGLARRGHEVHAIICRRGDARTDFDGGLWVHRVPPATDGPWTRPNTPHAVKVCLGRATAVHAAVQRLARSRFVDVVTVPLWGAPGAYCLLDDSLTCVLTLSLRPASAAPGVRALEQLSLRAARQVLALGAAGLVQVKAEYGEPGGAAVAVVPAADGDALARGAVRVFRELVERRLAA